MIVVKEIESWYLAGLDDKASQQLKVKCFDATDGLTKELFNSCLPNSARSRIDFVSEVMNRFSLDIALGKNASFNYFYNRILAKYLNEMTTE